jgi:cell division septation protein DedD
VAKAETKEAAGGAKTEARVAKAGEKKSEKVAPAEGTPKKADAAEAAEHKDQGKTWRAQVNAFPDERSAKQIVDRLKNKGYNAYVTEVQNQGKNWYRVSVGKYNSRDEADKMVDLLRTKENYPKAFAATR